VDDKIENVVTARSFGMHGIVFDNTANVVQQLKSLCGYRVELAKTFLRTNKKQLTSVTSSGVVLQEVRTKEDECVSRCLHEIKNYSQLLIQEATDDR
jgi:hypothetical protein